MEAALHEFRPRFCLVARGFRISDNLTGAAIAEALEDLPLPYRFDVKAYDTLRYPPLLDHIERVGIVIYQRKSSAQLENDTDASNNCYCVINELDSN
ncbi:hypothetical protein CCP2SC5_810008 [Azospirillaceae bacterium]